MRVVGYARTSTDEQTAGLAAQEATIRAAVDARAGWQLLQVLAEQASGADAHRQGLAAALQLVHTGQAQALMVARLDRLTRSLGQLGDLLEDARARGWVLIALDTGVDLSTPAGEMVAGVLGAAAVYERRLIGVRTREALAARRAAGVRLGGPRRCPDEVLAEVVRLRVAGARLVDIAAALQAAGHSTPGGGARWWPSHVSRLLATQDGQRALQAATAAAGGSTPCGS